MKVQLFGFRVFPLVQWKKSTIRHGQLTPLGQARKPGGVQTVVFHWVYGKTDDWGVVLNCYLGAALPGVRD